MIGLAVSSHDRESAGIKLTIAESDDGWTTAKVFVEKNDCILIPNPFSDEVDESDFSKMEAGLLFITESETSRKLLLSGIL